MILLAIHERSWMDFLGFHYGKGFQAFWISRPIAPAFLNGRCLRFSDLVQPFVATLLQTSAFSALNFRSNLYYYSYHLTWISILSWHAGTVPFPTVTALLVYRPLFIGSRGCANCIVTATCILIRGTAFSTGLSFLVFIPIYTTLVLSTRSSFPVC